MANWVLNVLTISALDQDTINSLTAGLTYAVGCSRCTDPIKISALNNDVKISKDNGSITWTLDFKTPWLPPVDLFKELEERAKNLKGVRLQAEWSDDTEMWNTWYSWSFYGDNFQILETGCHSDVRERDEKENHTQFPPEIIGKTLNYYEYLDNRDRWAGNIKPTLGSNDLNY